MLIARGAESELFRASASEVASAFVSGHWCDVPASGHMIMWENVPGWVDAISDFLQT